MQNYNSGAETTFCVGGLMEQVETTSGTDYRHYVYAGNEAVAILSRKTTLVNTWSYLLSDHVSSVSAITSSTGTVDITESFTSFGARRNPTLQGIECRCLADRRIDRSQRLCHELAILPAGVID
jgi:hypothetical protein